MTLKDFFRYTPPAVVDSTFTPEFLSSFHGISDLNGDGISDFLLLGAYYPIAGRTSPALQEARLLLSGADGNYKVASPSVFPLGEPRTIHARDVIFADFNGDGRPDIFVAAHGWDTSPFPGEQNKLILSASNGAWIDASGTLPQLSDFTHSADAGDYDNDGDIDLFIGNGYSGQNKISPYLLINAGNGQFSVDRSRIPAGENQVLDPNSQHNSPGALSSDVDGDGNLDLIITADYSVEYNKNKNTMIIWGNGSDFNGPVSLLPETKSFSRHIDIDAAVFDIDGDGDKDAIICGTQGDPFYDGYFIQVLRNEGNRTFVDITSQSLAPSEAMRGVAGQPIGAPWAVWIRPIDFDHNGHMDFAIEYGNIGAGLPLDMPLVWLNDGTGAFSAITVKDIVGDNGSATIQNGTIYSSKGGYSFLQVFSSKDIGTWVGGYTAKQPFMAGTAVADRFASSSFDDTLDGLTGRDTVSFAGKRSDYVVTRQNSVVTVADKIVGRDGNDTLSNIERLKFSDSVLAFDIDGNAGTIYRIYQAAFARTPDKAGISYWINQLDSGLTLRDVAYGFVVSPEFKTAYGSNPTNTQLVEKLYQNVLGRPAEKAGVDYWVGLLEQGTSVLDVVAAISESTENKTKVAGAIGATGIELDGSYFTV